MNYKSKDGRSMMCVGCHKGKPVKEFYANGRSDSDGLTKNCETCRERQRLRMRRRNGKSLGTTTYIAWPPGKPGLTAYTTGTVCVHSRRRPELDALVKQWATVDDLPQPQPQPDGETNAA